MSQIHILDGQKDEILDYITAPNIISDDHKKSLEDTMETYEFITFADKRFSEHLEKRNRIIIPDEDGSLVEFRIFEAHKYKDTEGHKAEVFANATYLDLRQANVLFPDNGFTGTASQHAGRALNDTGWQVGIVEGKGTRKLTINNHTNPYETLKRIAREFELELKFRVEHDGNKVTGRYVDLLERVGQWRGREVEFGKDLDGIRRVEKQDIVTALLGLGPEREDGTRLEVLVTDEDALQRWGRIDEHGNLHHLIEPYEIQSERSEMTEAEARQYTRTALNKRINTQITYETTIVDLEEVPGMENKKIRFGDTIKIKDTTFNPPLYLEARVFEQTRSIKTTAKKDIKLGDFTEYTEEEVNAIWEQLRKQIQNRVSFYEMAEYTYDKLTIDDKDETVFEDSKTFAEATGIRAEENAKAYAVEQDGLIKIDVEQYADTVAEQKANSALEQAKMYAVAKTVYENQMQQIASDIASRAPLEYVDGQLRVIEGELEDFNVTIEEKADKSTVYTIEEVDNRINNLVSVTQYETDQQGIVQQLESHGTRIGQNEHAIGLKADASHVDSVENELTRKIGNVEVTAEGASITASEVRADLDGLEIGGRNYFLHELLMTLSNVEYGDDSKGRWYEFNASSKLLTKEGIFEENTEYTLSFKLENSSESQTRLVVEYTDGTNNQVYSGSFTTPKNKTVSHVRITYSSSAGRIRLYNPVFNKGNKAADWSPAPEDADEAINQVSGRVETLDGEITALAGEVALKANQSVVDSLEGRVSTAEGELRVLPGQIEAKVSKDGVVGAINATPETLLIDFDKVKVTNEIEAKHIKSLNGLNVNNQFVVDNAGNVRFSGNLQGASGTFSGEIETGKLKVRAKSIHDFDDFGIELETAQWQPNESNPYVRTGFINFQTDNDALEINRRDLNGNRRPLAGFAVEADAIIFDGSVYIGAGGTGGASRSLEFHYGHFITTSASNDNIIIAPNRQHGGFEVRSHIYRSSYRTEFEIRASDGLIVSMPTANRTSTGSANLRVGESNGLFVRSSSSAKYKLVIEDIKVDPYKILDVNPRDWYDKENIETYAECLSCGDLDRLQDVENIRRTPGLVAEEVEAAGLGQFVEYSIDGEIEGVMYDRAWILLIPITNDHELKINDNIVRLDNHELKLTEQEKEIFEMKNEINSLKNEIEQLKGVA